MTIKPEVLAAIEQLDDLADAAEWLSGEDKQAVQLVRAELLAMDAEIERLNHLWEMMTNLAVKQKREIESLKEEQAMHNSAPEVGE